MAASFPSMREGGTRFSTVNWTLHIRSSYPLCDMTVAIKKDTDRGVSNTCTYEVKKKEVGFDDIFVKLWCHRYVKFLNRCILLDHA